MDTTSQKLTDSFGRHIRYLRISITDRCNLRCRYCMPEEGIEWLPHEGIMRYEEIARVVSLVGSLGVDKIRFTGGEPLVRKGVADFIKGINELDGISDLSLTTNAVLLGRYAQDIKKAGIKRLNISLDTLDKEKFAYIARVDAFDDVMAGINKSLELGLGIKINVVAIAGFNESEIWDFARQTLNKDIEVRFIELMPMGCAARLGDGNILRIARIKSLIENEFGSLEKVPYGLGPAKVYKIKSATGRIGFIDPMTEHSFCKRCNRIRLTANGQLKLCLFSEEGIDLLGYIRKGADDNELKQIIKNAVMLKPKEGIHISGRTSNSQMSRIGG
jgi:cyclic pyranopterin phosphate synthase